LQYKKTGIFNLETKRLADEQWKLKPAYYFIDKNDTTQKQTSLNFEVVYEN